MMYMADELNNLELEILAWMDGELDATSAAALEVRLAAMPEYQSLLTDLKRQHEVLAAPPRQQAVPAELSQRLRQLVEHSTPRQDVGRRYRLAASILLMLGVGVVVYQMLPEGATFAPSPQRQLAMDQIKSSDYLPGGDQPLIAAANYGVAKIAPLQNAQTVIYLSASDASAAQQQVTSVLRDNRIAFYELPQELASQVASNSGSSLQQFNLGLPQEAAARRAGEALARPSALEEVEREPAEKTKSPVPPAGATADTVRSRVSGPVIGGAGRKQEPDGSYANIPAAAPTAPAATAAVPMPVTAAPAPAAKLDDSKDALAFHGAEDSRRALPASAAAQQQVYVARNVRSDEVANVERQLQRPVQRFPQAARLRNTFNSQIPAPASTLAAGRDKSGAEFKKSLAKEEIATTQPATAPAPVVDLVIVVEEAAAAKK